MGICEKVFGFELTFKTSDKLFSYKSADKGTLLILDKCDIDAYENVLCNDFTLILSNPPYRAYSSQKRLFCIHVSKIDRFKVKER